MKISNKIKLFLKSMLMQAGEQNTDKGKLIFDGDALAVGMEVFVEIEGEDGVDYQPAEDGEYALEDGSIVVVAEGKVAEIKPAEEPEDEVVEEIEADVEVVEEIAEAVEPAAEPLDEPEHVDEPQNVDDRMDAIESHMADLNQALEMLLGAIQKYESRIAALEETLAKVAGEPAAPEAEVKARKQDEKDQTIVGKLKSFYSK